jgi:hypothetical protein
MDYVDWCEHVLSKLVEVADESKHGRIVGVDDGDIVQVMGNQTGDIDRRSLMHAIHIAVSDLAAVGLAQAHKGLVKVPIEGRNRVSDIVPVWENICRSELSAEHRELLSIVNERSPQATQHYVLPREIDHDELIDALPSIESIRQLWPVAAELEELGLVSTSKHMGGMEIRSTYAGQVWESRRDRVGEARLIDQLLNEGETTSIEFKRELNTKTADQKAEFIKDMLGLANTRASGPRLMLIGIDDETRTYYCPPSDRITQDHLEQLLAHYTQPVVEIRYTAVDHHAGTIGKLEVIRRAHHLPYAVARSVGDKKRIEDGDVFVRHGSQTEKPSPAELQEIQDEGDRARQQRQ